MLRDARHELLSANLAGRLVWRLAALVIVACGDPRSIVAAEPVGRLECPFLVTQIPVGSAIEIPGADARTAAAASSGREAAVPQTVLDPAPASQCGAMLRAPWGLGARIVLGLPNGTARVLSRGFHSAADPEVSYDGKRLLFAAKRGADDPWNIYEMGIDGSGLRQITRNLGDCRQPGYQLSQYVITEEQPWHQITFVRLDHRAVNEAGGDGVSSLYTCKLDGSSARRLTFNLSSDFDPAIMWDGRLVYASWRRFSLEHGPMGRVGLFEINTDGSDYAAFCLAAGKRVKHMPCTTSTGLAVFVENDQVPWDGAGQLGSVLLRRPLHTYRPITAPADGLFLTPSPLPDGRVLVSRRPTDGSGNHAVYRMDLATKQVELIYDDPRHHDVQAKAVVARPEPDGRSSVIDDADPKAILYCLDVYTSDLKDRAWMPRGAVKKVRIIEGLPRQADLPTASPLALQRVLAEVPLQNESARTDEDPATPHGSFSVEVPSNTPLQIQLLDEKGLALRSCGWIWARAHQAQGCIGCHEDGELTPENWQPAALWEKAVAASPPVPQRSVVDFRRDVMPIVAKYCAACHDERTSAPNLAPRDRAGEGGDAAAQHVYNALLVRNPSAENGGDYKYVHPGKARTSPLVWHLLGRNTAYPWDGAAAGPPAKLIPSGSQPAIPDEQKQVIIQWIDLGAAWDRPAVSHDNLAPGGDAPKAGR